MEACELIPESNTGRRNLSFRNPATNGGAATRTLSIGMQAVLPGEIAWAHRHSIGAVRFAIEGSSQLYTAVDGEKLRMETGDLVLTPANTWHDHFNEGDKVGIWLDVLDTALVFALHQTFYEAYGETTQPLRAKAADHLSERGGWLRPAWEVRSSAALPFRYPWTEARTILDKFSASDGSPYHGILLRYANPFDGGPTLPTMDCLLQLLKPQFATERRRQTASAVYHVIEGEGTTIVGDRELRWTARDSFAIPNWTWYQHVNRSASHNAILFCATDTPVLTALGLYREEPASTFRAAMPAVPANVLRRQD
jgi:gentisate 1,2-dioxygenase/1-hydroxy-2-naphthoate dioxygenase